MEEKKRPDEEEFKKLVADLRDWLEQKPYVPKNVEDKLYRRFVHSCYYDLEKAKVAADLFFSIRSSAPELLTDRDPLAPHMQKTIKITKFGLYRIPGNKNIWVWQLDDPGLYNYDHKQEAKTFILFADAWLYDDDVLQDEDIIVTDVKDMSWKIFTKFSFAVAKKISKYQQEAIPTRLKQIHIINAPSIIYRVFALFKPFISKEMMELIHIHTPNSTTLFDHISKDLLPEDFGGTRGKLDDYVAETYEKVIKYRDILLDENFWRVDPNAKEKEANKKEKETSKPVIKTSTDINSLQTLSID